MGNLGMAELLVVVFVALLVFGPDRLPELARQLGKAIARIRAETSRGVAELKQAADIEDLDRELRAISRELRDVRSSVGRALTAEPSAPTRADDAPPPTDPEAT